MIKSRARIARVILIASFLSDPAGAAALAVLSSPSNQSLAFQSSLFTEQAIVTSLLSNRRVDLFLSPVKSFWQMLKSSEWASDIGTIGDVTRVIEDKAFKRLAHEMTRQFNQRLPSGGLILIDGLSGATKTTFAGVISGDEGLSHRRFSVLHIDAFLRGEAYRKPLEIAMVREGHALTDYPDLAYRTEEMERFLKAVLGFLSSTGDPTEERTFEVPHPYWRAEQLPLKLRRQDLLIIEGGYPHLLDALKRTPIPVLSYRLLPVTARARLQFQERSQRRYPGQHEFLTHRMVHYDKVVIPSWELYASRTESAVDYEINLQAKPEEWSWTKRSKPSQQTDSVNRLTSRMTQTPKRLQFKNYEALSQQAADEVRQTLEKKADAVLLLPTGNTPLRMYELLVEMARQGRIDFSRATIFMLDEYYGGTDYRDYIQEHLIQRLPPGAHPQVHVLDGRVTDISGETQSYEHQIHAAGGIDLAVLGIGPEGHIGFNEAGSPFDSTTRLVQLADSTIKANYALMNSAAPYTHALTVGIYTILTVKKIIVLASGEKKAPAVAALFNGLPTPDWPVTALQYHDNVTALIDDAAAVGIPAQIPSPPVAGFLPLGLAQAGLFGAQGPLAEIMNPLSMVMALVLTGGGAVLTLYGALTFIEASIKANDLGRQLRRQRKKAVGMTGIGLFLVGIGLWLGSEFISEVLVSIFAGAVALARPALSAIPRRSILAAA